MKKLLSILSIAVVLTACSSAKNSMPSKEVLLEQAKNVAVEMISKAGVKNISNLVEYLPKAQNIVSSFMGYGKYEGKDVRVFTEATKDGKVNVETTEAPFANVEKEILAKYPNISHVLITPYAKGIDAALLAKPGAVSKSQLSEIKTYINNEVKKQFPFATVGVSVEDEATRETIME